MKEEDPSEWEFKGPPDGKGEDVTLEQVIEKINELKDDEDFGKNHHVKNALIFENKVFILQLFKCCQPKLFKYRFNYEYV